MKFTLFLVALFTIFLTIAYGQNLKTDPWTEKGVLALVQKGNEQEILNNCTLLTTEGNFYLAKILSDKLLEFKPNSSNYNYRNGFLLLEYAKDYKKAIPKLEIAIKDIDNDYDMFSTKEISAPADAFFYLAKAYHFQQELDSAENNYTNFLKSTRKKSALISSTLLKLQQIKSARKIIPSPVNVTLKNLGEKVNTEYPEYSSVVSLDGSALYFTSRRPWENMNLDTLRDPETNQFREDIYVSYLDFDSTWTEPMRLDFCNPSRNEATVSVSTDERKIYIYQDDVGNGDIFISEFYLQKFNEINQLSNPAINTEYWETHAFVSQDGKDIYFTSDIPGGYGKRDIYKISKDFNGVWGKPINLGPSINGDQDDDAPFLSIDGKQLYFATNDGRSIGGFDIMISELDEFGNWKTATNVGFPFNSTNDDLFYTTTVDGLRGYITSDRGNGQGEKDIYEVKNDFLGVKTACLLNGIIQTEDGSPLPEDFAINVIVTCEDCPDGQDKRVIFPRLRDGRFMSQLQPCKTYNLVYNDATSGEIMGEESFTTKCDVKFEEIERKLILDVDNRLILFPKDVVTPVDPVVSEYANIELMHYFDYNKNKLSTSSGELKDFVKEVENQLKEGREKIIINIYSSASYVPTRTYVTNDKLAIVRAENMKKEILEYFKDHSNVTVEIVQAVVQGPEYVNDASQLSKYRPYQYVGLKTK